MSMSYRLSPLDRSALVGEVGPVNMTVGSLIFVEHGPGVTFDAICQRIRERIHLVPRCRQRLDEGRTGVRNAVWADDPDFDVEYHIHTSALPAPGGHAELMRYVGNEMSRKIDRSRPLWELHLIAGLEDGRLAILMKMHHAMVDGASALGIGLAILDESPEPATIAPPQDVFVEEAKPGYTLRMARNFAIKPMKAATQFVSSSTRPFLEPLSTAQDMVEAAEVLRELMRERPPAVHTPFNNRISANRTYDCMQAPLQLLKDIAESTGRTLNDVLLAVVAGMLAKYLHEAGVDPATLSREPSTLVPVNIRKPGEVGGNRISVVIAELPVKETDPLKRVQIAGKRMDELKEAAGVMAGALFVVVGGIAPPLLAPALTTMLSVGIDFPSHNLVVSNVPGPKHPLYLNGAKVLEIYPIVPLNPADQGLNVGAFSYAGTVYFGFSADKRLTPGVTVIKDAFDAALRELADAAGVRSEPAIEEASSDTLTKPVRRFGRH
ncbi:wax ester/triacylglycerol synthase family O-acyltransferase [Smaragdicoccus niigatensis]|uniref:wax ester/triacylglycerol synthase family O-acyltransferase n=1 Tax=Smaragdicoccus niigatensis TaxID=359359 RepID=UPI00035FDAE1|nr:wax ester/triacylglycerol synthase family O-acyltransferase [Smaragdicoccus niigatensis]